MALTVPKPVDPNNKSRYYTNIPSSCSINLSVVLQIWFMSDRVFYAIYCHLANDKRAKVDGFKKLMLDPYIDWYVVWWDQRANIIKIHV